MYCSSGSQRRVLTWSVWTLAYTGSSISSCERLNRTGDNLISLIEAVWPQLMCSVPMQMRNSKRNTLLQFGWLTVSSAYFGLDFAEMSMSWYFDCRHSLVLCVLSQNRLSIRSHHLPIRFTRVSVNSSWDRLANLVIIGATQTTVLRQCWFWNNPPQDSIIQVNIRLGWPCYSTCWNCHDCLLTINSVFKNTVQFQSSSSTPMHWCTMHS